MVAVPVLPVTTLIFETEEASVKLGAGVTLNGRVAVAETLPDVAVMVNEAVVTGAELLTVSVSLLVEVVLAGLNAAVTPLGNPEMVRAHGAGEAVDRRHRDGAGSRRPLCNAQARGRCRQGDGRRGLVPSG